MRFWVVIVSFLERKEIRVKEVRGLTLANDSLWYNRNCCESQIISYILKEEINHKILPFLRGEVEL